MQYSMVRVQMPVSSRHYNSLPLYTTSQVRLDFQPLGKSLQHQSTGSTAIPNSGFTITTNSCFTIPMESGSPLLGLPGALRLNQSHGSTPR